VDALAYYAPRWRAFTEDGRTVHGSCYGQRIFGRGPAGSSRWDALLSLLREDPASRRAVIDLSGEGTLSPTAVDVSCTSTIQVLVRNGLIHLIVQMRSNDAVWGLPYDVFLFTMIQEMLACTLGLEVGTYIHGTGSLHLYERHLGLARRVLGEEAPPFVEMPRMGPISELDDFLAAERAIRLGEKVSMLSSYWNGLANTLKDFSRSQRGKSLSAVPG
jgi:thymidylate synthase